MKYLLEVCLVSLTLAVDPITCAAAQSQAPTTAAMQKGISVQLPLASSAIPMPEADQEDALIVSVTDDGDVYVGIDPTSPIDLAEKIKGDLSSRTEKKLYIKADARTAYSNVVKVLDAMRTAGFEAPNLLTHQRDSSELGTLVPPKGIEVLVRPSSLPGPGTIVVQVLNSGQQGPKLKINKEQIPWPTLQSTLRQLFQNQRERVVQVSAEGKLRFADVVRVIDACSSAGAKVVLVTPGP
jgi:biopolymer transport protein TolR